MLVMSRENVAWYQSQVIVSVARNIEAPDYEFYTAVELYEMIREGNPSVFNALEAFLDAHNKWWEFQEEHESEITKNGLPAEQNQKNIELIRTRDSTRQSLIDLVRK